MSNGPTSQPNTPGGPGHQSGPPGYPPQGHPAGHPGYHPQGYFPTIIIRSTIDDFRLSKSSRVSTASWTLSTTRYAAIWWWSCIFGLSATSWLSTKPSISSIPTSISRFILDFHFCKILKKISKVTHQEHPVHILQAVHAVQWVDHQIQISPIHMEPLLMVDNR